MATIKITEYGAGLIAEKIALLKTTYPTFTVLAEACNCDERTLRRFRNPKEGVERGTAIAICNVLGLALEQVTSQPFLAPNRPVAIVFTDLVSNTNIRDAFARTHGSEADERFRSQVQDPHCDRVSRLLGQYQGQIIKWTGDGYLLVFESVSKAVEWAVAVQSSHITDPIVTPLGNLQTRIGIHWGIAEVINKNGNDDLDGLAVNLAARIMGKACGEQILLSEAARTAISEDEFPNGLRFHCHGNFSLKGIANDKPVNTIYDVLWNDRPPKFVGVDWVAASRKIVEEQIERERFLRRNITHQGAELDVFVELGLVQPKQKTPARKGQEEMSPDREITQSQLEEKEITKVFGHQEFLSELLNSKELDKKHLCIAGEPGAGKSTWLNKIATYLTEKGEIVICLSLSQIQGDDLDEEIKVKWLKKALEGITEITIEEAYDRLKNEVKQVWLLLDGVDEIRLAESIEPVGRLKNLLVDTWIKNHSRIIITCRLNVWQNNLNTMTDFATFRTMEFSPDQVLEFIGQWFSKLGEKQQGEELKQRLREANNRGERIAFLACNPLRLAMICQSWHIKEGQLPETKADLYEAMGRNFYDWKRSEFPLSDIEKERLDTALSKLALASIEEGKLISYTFARQQMGDKEFEKARQLGWLNQTHMNIGTQEGYYAFYHLTFKEFFAAKAIPDYWDEKRQIPGWDYFMPCNHDQGKPVDGKRYRIFEPRWKEVILLWLGRGDVEIEQKAKFLGVKQKESDKATGLAQLIESIGGTGDGCGDYYAWKVIFFMVQATAEVGHINQRYWRVWVDGIVRESVGWALGKYDSEQEQWISYEFHPVSQIARDKLLIEAYRPMTIDSLVNLLTKDGVDYITLCKVAEILGKIAVGNQVAIDAMVNLLKQDLIDDIRLSIAQNLGMIDLGNQVAIDALVNLLMKNGVDNYTYQEAADSLVGQGNHFAIDALVNLLQQDGVDNFTRQKGARILGKIDPGNKLAIDALVNLLIKDGVDADTSEASAWSLGWIGQGNQVAIDTLVNLLTRGGVNNRTRQASVWSLGKIGKGIQIVIDTLVNFLNQDRVDADTRQEVVESLSMIGEGNQVAIDALVNLLNQDGVDDWTRQKAAKSLGEIGRGNQVAINALVNLLYKDGIDNWTRRYVTKSLGMIGWGNQVAIDALTNLMKQDGVDDWTRLDAADNLGMIGQCSQVVIDTLVNLLMQDKVNDRTHRYATEILGRIGRGNQIAIDALANLLKNARIDNSTRKEATESLGRIGGGNQVAIDALANLLKNARIDNSTRKEATKSLGHILQQANMQIIASTVALLKTSQSKCVHTFEVLLKCAEFLPYEGKEGFYAAWNGLLPTSTHPEVLDKTPANISIPASISDQIAFISVPPYLCLKGISLPPPFANETDRNGLSQGLGNLIIRAFSIRPRPTITNQYDLQGVVYDLLNDTDRQHIIFVFYGVEPSQIMIEIFQLLYSDNIHILIVCDTPLQSPMQSFPTNDRDLSQHISSWISENIFLPSSN